MLRNNRRRRTDPVIEVAAEPTPDALVDEGEEPHVDVVEVFFVGDAENQGQIQGTEVEEVENELGGESNTTIEITGEEENESVIDLTSDTNGTSNSPIRLGRYWTESPFFLARVPPVPRTPHNPPVMVDLTNSPGSDLESRSCDSLHDLDNTASPGGVSLQCPVCLDKLKTIKRTGRVMMSTVCGHIFCNTCLPASIKASSRCPTCRRGLTDKDFHKIFI